MNNEKHWGHSILMKSMLSKLWAYVFLRLLTVHVQYSMNCETIHFTPSLFVNVATNFSKLAIISTFLTPQKLQNSFSLYLRTALPAN